MRLIVLMCLFVASNASNLKFLTTVDNVSMDNSSSYVLMGNTFNCSTVEKLSSFENQSILMVLNHNKPEAYCSESLIDQDYSTGDEQIGSVYRRISSLGSSTMGNVLNLYKGTFNIDLIAINGRMYDAMGWITATLNQIRSSAATLYVLVINNLEFTSDFQRSLFHRILESRQIIHLILGQETNETIEFPKHTILETEALDFNLESDGVYINITANSNKFNYVYNIMSALDCDYPLCFTDCTNVSDTDFCIKYSNFTPNESIARHYNYRLKDLCGIITRPRRDYDYPTWFLKWLQKTNLITPDTTFTSVTSRMANMYFIAVNPKNGVFTSEGLYYSRDCNTVTEQYFANTNGDLKFTMTQKNEPVTLYNYAYCYHGIVSRGKGNCKTFNVVSMD